MKEVKKTVAAKSEEVKATSEKKVETAVKAVETETKKAAAVKETVSLQYLGKDIKTADLMEQVKNIWTGELGKDAADLKAINLYLKPEDNAAYYVINESFSGRIDF